MNKFRLPKIVTERIAKGLSDGAQRELPDALSLREVASLFHRLRKAEDLTTKESLALGGIQALNWCWRVLQNEKVIKVHKTGDVLVPELVDSFFGPSIVMVTFEESVEKVEEAIVKGTAFPFVMVPRKDGKTAVFYQHFGHGAILKNLEKAEMQPISFSFKDAVVFDIGNQLKSFRKAAVDAPCGYSAQAFEYPAIEGVTVASAHLLTANIESLYNAEFVKVDEELGLVFGWAIICTQNGEEYFDKQGDHIPEHGMLEAAVDFMLSDRVSKEMHVGDGKGTVVFLWPMTSEVAKAFGVKTDTTGMMIAVRPEDPKYLDAFKSGELTGFSIGGHRYRDHTEVVSNAE